MEQQPKLNKNGNLELNKIQIIDLGPACLHNQPCAVYHSDEEAQYAVFDLNEGVFNPSWKAQSEGWQLVRLTQERKVVIANTSFKRWLLWMFF